MAKFDIKTVKPKFVVTTSPENKIDVVVNKPIITSKNTKSFFKLKNTGGPRGEKGEQGDAATITVASTSTGAAGTDASVVNQGTAQDAQLAFTIPRGDKGDTGATGPAGYSPEAKVVKTGRDAVITIQDQSGTTTATVSDGQDGQDGQAATITVDSTTTLPAGSSATVENVGTDSAARLAFGIPKGDTGAAGQDGFSPIASVTQTQSGATISITDEQGTTTASVTNGTNGQDGEAATIQVGQVETLEPNQQAYVTNVGTSEAAIFNIGIPKGQKGDSGSGSGDMTASVYDPNGTVAAAGGIPDYVDTNGGKIDTIKVNGTTQTITNKTVDLSVPTKTSDITNDSGYITSASLPTKTSDLTNDGADGTSTYVEANDLATVATSGSYNDLSNKPTIPAAQVNSDWNAASGVAQILNKPTLAAVATSGSYNDLSNKPTIPENMVVYANNSLHSPEGITGLYTTSALTTAASASSMVAAIQGGNSVIVLSSTNEAVEITSFDDHASGSPSTISFTGQFLSNWKTNSPEFIKFTYTSTTSTWSAEGATLPTVNDATLTIQRNGTTVQTFTANQSTNATANITVPTQLSDLSGTISTSQIADGAVTSAKIDWSGLDSHQINGFAPTTTKNLTGNWQYVEFGTTTDTMKAGTYLLLIYGMVNFNNSGGEKYYRWKCDAAGIVLSTSAPKVDGYCGVIGFGVVTIPSDGTYTWSIGLSSQNAITGAQIGGGPRAFVIRIG